jgi:hypothetical protein
VAKRAACFRPALAARLEVAWPLAAATFQPRHLPGALARRASLLAQYHRAGVLDLDFQDLKHRAAATSFIGADLAWREWARWSARQGTMIQMGGLMGTALLPMAGLDPAYAVLPADTRMPDHTIWNHADTVAAFATAVGATGHGAHALLSFAISPVQSCIAAARSLRDLRNGCLLLSWLAFRAMRPVLERIGPTALIFPSLPNKFLALVPMGPDGAWAHALAGAVETAAADAWHEVARAVRRALGESLDAAFPGWDARWETQIDQTWDFVASIMPLRELGSDEKLAEFRGEATFAAAFPEAQKVRDLAAAIRPAERPRYDQNSAGRWQASVDLAARLLEAARGVRRVPVQAPFAGEVPAKCSLLGTWEQVGPGKRDKGREFWEHVASLGSIKRARVRKGEALEHLVLAWAEETRSTRLRVNLFDPGVVRTRLRAQAMPGENPAGLPRPETVAPAIAALCHAEERRHGELVRAAGSGRPE